MGYAIVRGIARLLLGIFYRRLDVSGLERVPRRGPLVVAANHHNALVDPMLLLAAIPRRLSPLAKAPLFAHPLIAPFLWLAGAIPVHRRQDAGVDPARNAAMFAAASARLRAGGAVLIFPEGVSQPEPVLLPLRTGLARLALAARASAPDLEVAILPVGLVFHRPAEFRAGRALVAIGEPIPVPVPAAGDAAAHVEAVRALTDRVAAALRSLIVEAEDRQTLRVLEVAHAVWREDGDEAPAPERLAWMQEALRRWRALPPDLRARASRLRVELERHAEVLADPGPPARRRRALAAELLAAVVGLPLALLGLAVHGPAYRATALVVRALRPEPDTAATYQLAVGLVLFPLTWLAEAAALAWTAGPFAVAGFLALLAPAGFFALAWRERLHRFRRDLAAWRRGGERGERLRVWRRWLRDELRALARLSAARAAEEVGP